jgi:23S rRNA G2445 N2-methylase RlmL
MCGSGTFLIEAAVRAQGLSPGRLRTFTCDAWSKPGRGVEPKQSEIQCLGNDRDDRIIRGARRNAKRAGVPVTLSSLEAVALKAPAKTGLLVCNPPYGLRLKQGQGYETLGRVLANEFQSWRGAIVCPSEAAITALGRKPAERIHFSMGGVPLILALLNPAR